MLRMGARRARVGMVVLALAAQLAANAGPAVADQNDRTHRIGNKLKCMCSGCEQSAGQCYHVGGAYSGPCDTAKAMLKEIDGHIAQGKTDEQVLQAMIAEYGPLAYMEPPKTGFGLVAWLLPVLYLLAGTAVVILVMRRWRRRPEGIGAAATTSAHAEVTPELLARARELARRETEE